MRNPYIKISFSGWYYQCKNLIFRTVLPLPVYTRIDRNPPKQYDATMPKRKSKSVLQLDHAMEPPPPPALPADPFTPALLPAHIDLNPYHPAQNEFMRELSQLRTEMRKIKQRNPVYFDQIVSGHMAKRSLTWLTRFLPQERITQKKARDKVREIINSDDALQLMSLQSYYDMALKGAPEELKKHMLYKLAVNNEEIDPKVTISAISELNKMSGTYAKAQGPSNQINIQINNELLPKGPLDQ